MSALPSPEDLELEVAAAAEPEDIGAEPLPRQAAEPVENLAHLVPALWRTMKRGATTAAQLPANESQVFVLRMLVLHGPLTPTRLAEVMQLARPTVSNLLRVLIASGLVRRESGEGDGRSALLSATTKGRDLLEQFRRDRADLLREALARLPEDEQDLAPANVTWLRHLLRQLEVVASERAEVDGQ